MSAHREAQVLSFSARPAGNVVLGRFEGPQEEQRIVTFIDLVDSTGIAERLGSVRFHAFLSDVFSRLSRVVGQFGGEVHRYVGDALIATWPLGSVEKNTRSILALFECRAALEAAEAHFHSRFGEKPEFRASLHCGPLVAAEIGTFKREIALVGDAMNTAARIEQVCRMTGRRLLASRALMMRVALPFDAIATSLGNRRLRGKSERVALFALEPRRAVEDNLCLFQACA